MGWRKGKVRGGGRNCRVAPIHTAGIARLGYVLLKVAHVGKVVAFVADIMMADFFFPTLLLFQQ